MGMKQKKILRIAAVLLLMAAVLLRADACAKGAKSGLDYALGVLVPALFPFLILTTALASWVETPKPFLFFLLSIVGGYPAAAASLAAFSEKEGFSAERADAIVCTAINPGVSFLFAVVAKLLPDPRLAALLAVSVYLSSAILFFGYSIVQRPRLVSNKPAAGGRGLIFCVAAASQSILKLSALVVAFSALGSVLSSFGADALLAKAFCALGLRGEEGASILSGALEITGGIRKAAENGCSLYFFAAILAFGGICVHCQVFSLLSGKIGFSKAKFYLFRVLHAALACLILRILSRLIRPEAFTVLQTEAASAPVSAQAFLPSGAALCVLCGIFLVTFKNGVEIPEKV